MDFAGISPALHFRFFSDIHSAAAERIGIPIPLRVAGERRRPSIREFGPLRSQVGG
jgi:hypothetical protein